MICKKYYLIIRLRKARSLSDSVAHTFSCNHCNWFANSRIPHTSCFIPWCSNKQVWQWRMPSKLINTVCVSTKSIIFSLQEKQSKPQYQWLYRASTFHSKYVAKSTLSICKVCRIWRLSKLQLNLISATTLVSVYLTLERVTKIKIQNTDAC